MSEQTPQQKWSVGPGPVGPGAGTATRTQPAAPTAGAHESPCPECGEMVRKGLLRCWNCGAFMEASTQARYQALQANPAPTIFSQVPADEIVSVDSADDDDFELSTVQAPAPVTRTDLSRLETASGAPAAEAPPSPADTGPATAHSVATGGDVLLQVALLQEAESKLRRRRRPLLTGGAKTPGGFIIFCPYGCRVEVKEQHRGMAGRCPRCKAPFTVPIDPPDYSAAKKKAADAEKGETGAAAAGGFKYWLEDLHVHTVPPEKLKLKADSLTKDFADADFGFGPDGMLIVSLMKKGGGLFGSGGDKKKAETRAAMLQHLQEGKPRGELPVGEQQLITPEQLRQLHVVQPAASRAASMFHGVPVFGAGRIAILLAATDENAPPRYVSLGINQFRRMAQALAEQHGIENFGADSGVPIEDEFQDAGKCHYLGVPVRGIKNIEFYRADPTCEVIVSGWKCAGCGLVISEDAREKEKLGGKGGKGLAKVKCPKCQQKFGEQPIHTLKQTASHPSMTGEEASSTTPSSNTPAAQSS